MSISSEISRINGNIAEAYAQVSAKGGTLPGTQNSANLPEAIESIPSGGVKLASIAITTPPVKTAYRIGETFSTAGMVVTATYSNGATMQATGYNFEPSVPLTLSDTSVTIRYTEGGVTKTATQAITVEKLDGAVTLSKSTVTLDNDHLTDTITVTRLGDGAITAQSSDTGVATVSVSGNTVTVSSVNGASGSATITVTAAESATYKLASSTASVSAAFVINIYGVSWAGTSATTLTRTDAAAGFADPVPAVNKGTGSSPFDTIRPWSGMVKEERTGGTMVKIPKFWYKLTQNGNGVKIQIADGAVEGFSVSPAHMDRGDGKGERDYVYVGRYHCASDYKSKTGVKPVARITRSSARSSIHNLGANIWQCDFAMRFTIWLLYIVEFADWDSQTKIGYGCGNNSVTENMGYTDSMQYHTGTTKSDRTTYGVSTQYRWIEGLWDNVYDWCDGCYYNDNGLNIILNPSSFSDSSGGTLAGNLTAGYPSALRVKSVSGIFPVFVPSASSGSNTTYVPDAWNFGASAPCLHVGGYYKPSLLRGMFYVSYYGASISDASVGCRLQELP